MCVTSPPYYALRDYGIDGQIGLENTPEEYVNKLVEVFKEVKRTLKDDGTLWLNIGDSYAGGGRGSGYSAKQDSNKGTIGMPKSIIPQGIKSKDLIGIPWMLAFALRADGWYLRQDIIWAKPNPMPESVKDRCTKSHEYIFLLSKSAKYYYDADAIKEDAATKPHKPGNILYSDKVAGPMDRGGCSQWETNMNKTWGEDGLRNRRDVWTVTTKPFKGAHFATFPPDLIKPCILAGCPENGIVLDPFMGSGTTAKVSKSLSRNYSGIDIQPEYIKIAEERIG